MYRRLRNPHSWVRHFSLACPVLHRIALPVVSRRSQLASGNETPSSWRTRSCPTRPLLGPQPGGLLEGSLHPRYARREHLTGLDPDDLAGVDRRRGIKTNLPGDALAWRSPARERNPSLRTQNSSSRPWRSWRVEPVLGAPSTPRKPLAHPISSPVAFSVMASVPGSFLAPWAAMLTLSGVAGSRFCTLRVSL